MTTAQDGQAGTRIRTSRALFLLLSGLVGITLAVSGWVALKQSEKRKILAELSDHAKVRAEAFRIHLADSLMPLDAIAAFHGSSARFDYSTYRTFVTPLILQRYFS
jgi:hypothetical protein